LRMMANMSEPRCLIDEEGRAPLFQGSFVGHGKWFRGPWVHPDEER
jgi:hypothetical protein